LIGGILPTAAWSQHRSGSDFRRAFELRSCQTRHPSQIQRREDKPSLNLRFLKATDHELSKAKSAPTYRTMPQWIAEPVGFRYDTVGEINMSLHKSLKIMMGIEAASRIDCVIASRNSTRRGWGSVVLSNLGHRCRSELFGGPANGCLRTRRAVDRFAKEITVPPPDLHDRMGAGKVHA
jgi:hypothetical protein